MPDLHTALRLALFVGGHDNLLRGDDHGMDLYDAGLMRDERKHGEVITVPTSDGKTLLRAASGR